MRKLLLGALLFCSVLLLSCEESQHGLTTRITGKPGEVLVVSSLDISKTALRDTLEAILKAEFPYIPQSEPSFSTVFVTEKTFSHILQPFRNILFINFDSTKVSLRTEQDRWAAGQRLLYLSGPDQRSMATYLGAHKELFYNLFEEFERTRLQQANLLLEEKALGDSVRRLFGLSLCFPRGYQLRRSAPDFRWYSIETKDISQGVLLYKFKRGADCWALDTLIAHRDSMTRQYIPGPNPGTYMKTAQTVPPALTQQLLGADTVYQVRGFWEVHGHAMGGAFLSYSRLSPGRDSVITTEGYIYAPKFKKRDYVRALDALLRSQF